MCNYKVAIKGVTKEGEGCMNAVQEMEALAGEWHCGVERKGKGHVHYIAHPRAEVTDLSMEHVRMGANSNFFGLFLRNALQPVPQAVLAFSSANDTKNSRFSKMKIPPCTNGGILVLYSPFSRLARVVKLADTHA